MSEVAVVVGPLEVVVVSGSTFICAEFLASFHQKWPENGLCCVDVHRGKYILCFEINSRPALGLLNVGHAMSGAIPRRRQAVLEEMLHVNGSSKVCSMSLKQDRRLAFCQLLFAHPRARLVRS